MILLSTLLITKMHTLDLWPQELILRKSGLNEPFLSRRPIALKRCTAGSRRCLVPSWRSGGLAARRLLYVSCSLGWHARVPPSCPVIFPSIPLILLVSLCTEIDLHGDFHTNWTCKIQCISNVVLPCSVMYTQLSVHCVVLNAQAGQLKNELLLCLRSSYWSVSLDLA